MTFADKLGMSYTQVRDQVKIKKIEVTVGNVNFNLRVRVPLKREMELMLEKISSPDDELVESIYQKLSAPIKESVAQGGDEFLEAMNKENQVIKITDDDVILDGNSVRQVATFTAMWETKVQEYFHLLQSENGEPIDETYEQITEEFPEPVIRQIVEDIESAIKPDYKTAKKN
jgi:hypothetical protein